MAIKIEQITNAKLNEDIKKLEKKYSSKPKKVLTQKQKEILEKGRQKRAAYQRALQYKKAVQMQLKIKEKNEIVTFKQFEARVRYTMREYGVTRKQAIKMITTSRLFRTQDELFKIAIKSYAQLPDYTKIRTYIWKILKEENPEAVKNGWINYNTTKINWDEFVYDEFIKALVYSRNGHKIIISVKKGKNSTDPDWLNIKYVE